MSDKISNIMGRRVWDSRGRPTVEAEVFVEGGSRGRAIAPAGASTGSGEALDKRDGGERFGGYDVLDAVSAINNEIRHCLIGQDVTDQERIDTALIELDGTPSKRRLGGNSIVAVSMASAHAAADHSSLPLWRYFASDKTDFFLPLPEIQIFGGGAHAGRRVDVQDFMVIAIGAESYAQSLEWTAEIYLRAGELMKKKNLLYGVADEGGYWPVFTSNEEALDFLTQAIEAAGYRPGEDVAISLDIAATDFRRATDSGRTRYRLNADGREVDSAELRQQLSSWLKAYPIVAIEDPVAEDDFDGMVAFTNETGPAVEIVADDFICTDADRIRKAASQGACNTALIKPNQVGTLTESKAALDAARETGWQAIVSARSGETEDITIVHLAVGWGIKQLKVGSFSRSERMAKWNEGLRIAESLAETDGQAGGRLPPRNEFPWG